MVEQMVNPQYEFMEQYFASLCEGSGGSGLLIFHEKETAHVKSWSTSDFQQILNNVKQSIKKPPKLENWVKGYLQKQKLMVKEKRRLLTTLAGPPDGRSSHGWFQQESNAPPFWAKTGLPFGSLNNQRKHKPCYLNSAQMTRLIDSYKRVIQFGTKNKQVITDDTDTNDSAESNVDLDSSDDNGTGMEIEDENSTGTLHEDNRSGEEDMFFNQIEDDHVDEEDRNRDKEEYEVQVNDLETNTKMVLTKPIPNQYLTKCKKCQSKNRLKGTLQTYNYGLCNINRSCSISTALTILRSCKGITEFQGDLAREYEKHCQSRITKAFHPGKILYWLESEMNLPTDEDKDAQEVLLKILEPNPNIKSLFQFKTKSTVQCMECNYTNQKEEIHTIYNTHLDKESVSLKSWNEKLEGYKCHRSKREQVECTKRWNIITYPQCLLFYIQRLHFEDGKCTKSLKKISYKHSLPVPQNPLSVQYQLVCVSYHHGDVEEGHYLSNILDGKQWLKVNDCKVTNITPNTVLSHKENVYMLAYKRISINS